MLKFLSVVITPKLECSLNWCTVQDQGRCRGKLEDYVRVSSLFGLKDPSFQTDLRLRVISS